MCKHFYIIDITGARNLTKSGNVVVCTKCGKIHQTWTKRLRKLEENTFVQLKEVE